MNEPLDDETSFNDPVFSRTAWRGVWVLWAAIVAYFAGMLFVPRPFKAAIGLGGMAVLCFAVLGFVCWLAPRSPALKHMRPAMRRYVTRFLPAVMLYAVIFEADIWYFARMQPTGFVAALAALAPTVPVLFAIRAMVTFLKEETDEYLRSRALETWALATGLALSVCTVWGFLDQFEVVPHLPLWAAFPLWACCIGPALLLLNRRT